MENDGGVCHAHAQLNKSPNKILKALLCALQCCFLCVERFLKMLTKNAYVEVGPRMRATAAVLGVGPLTDSGRPVSVWGSSRTTAQIAVYGYSFCAAARHAMEIITRNILR